MVVFFVFLYVYIIYTGERGVGDWRDEQLTSLGIPPHSIKGASPKARAGSRRAQEMGNPHEECLFRCA